MSLIMGLLFLLIVGYYIYKFIEVIIEMKNEIILPITEEDISDIRKYPQKEVDYPVYSKQRVGIILYAFLLLFPAIIIIVGMFFQMDNWYLYPMVVLPLTYSTDVLNLFAITKDGILSGNSFIPWKKIKSYDFYPIDINHRYYGHSREVNDRYELIIRSKVRRLSCVVTSDDMKEKLDRLLEEYIGTSKQRD
ncbi:hypothetical protein GMD78_18195 [Ornithinibacillus sp. L9]|uniref:DUF5673 domain-containing protein n=1 Tax=Ornithinibacillus caprae TaxID=2678566 RepID=A0A6N8FQ09_9BACI|nr:hypothetical protein [Ornithinibacillus caprae]MUK90307.1 hypothetical protein [Ornithinibacillus caprae]